MKRTLQKLISTTLTAVMLLSAAPGALAANPSPSDKQAEVYQLASDYFASTARVEYLFASADLIADTVSALPQEELTQAVQTAEESPLDITVNPEIGRYLDGIFRYRRYTRIYEGQWVQNFSARFFVNPTIVVEDDCAKVSLTINVGMRYLGLDEDSAIATRYDVDLIRVNGQWKIASLTSDDYRLNPTGPSFDYDQAVTDYRKTAGPAAVFADVPAGKYYSEPVLWAAVSGIASGTRAGYFSPNAPCTRGQTVTFLWKRAGCPEPSAMASFPDMPANPVFQKAISWAVEQGITCGTGKGGFSPDKPCTRGEAVAFLWAAEGKGSPEKPAGFGDMTGSAGMDEAIGWAVERGITSGTGGNRFSPYAPCSRGQIVTFLYLAGKDEEEDRHFQGKWR